MSIWIGNKHALAFHLRNSSVRSTKLRVRAWGGDGQMPAVEPRNLTNQPHPWSLYANDQNIHPIRAELFGLEHLEAHARELGEWMAATRVEAGRPLPKQFARNVDILRGAHQVISEAYRHQEALGHEAEWLLDNYYIITDAIAEIRTALPHGYYHRLPKLTEGLLAGYPRVYAIALDLTAHCDSCFDETNIT